MDLYAGENNQFTKSFGRNQTIDTRRRRHQRLSWNQVRERSRGEFQLIFICALKQYLDLMNRYNLLPDQPDLAVDFTC